MAKEYDTPWEIEGDFVITANGKYHKNDIQSIVDQRDHEVNNLKCVNQMLTLGFNETENKPETNFNKRVSKNIFLRKYLKLN